MELHFKNGRFKLVQFTDIQEIADFSPDTENLIRAILEKENPDLAILTGDQIKGYGMTMQGGSDEEKAAAVIDRIADCFHAYHVPFAVVFGNHDEFRSMTKKKQWELYKKSPYFLCESEETDGCYGIFNLPVFSSDGKIKFSIYGFDSRAKDKAIGTYQNVPQEQIEWYRRKREELKSLAGDYVPSLAFQHIPVPEVYELMDVVPKHTKGAVRGAGKYAKNYYVLGSKTQPGGFMRENAAVPMQNSGEFDALCEKGDIMGLYFGHDHNNSFVGSLNGVTLGYTQSCGFNAYGPGTLRGARVFEIDENDPRCYTQHTVTYGELFKNQYQKPIRSIAYNYAPSSVGVVLNVAKKIGFAAALLGTAVVVKKKFL